MIKPFDLLIKNKSDYTNSKFFNKAILPEILNGHNTMNVLSEDDFNQGSSFGNTVDYRIIDKISVDTIMVKDFIDENKNLFSSKQESLVDNPTINLSHFFFAFFKNSKTL